MKNDSLISIIVPAFNVGKYITKCIKSVISQTYSNIEVIIINDGSSDNTKMICESFATIDKRIHLINQVNQGLSASRNLGVKLAHGNYIGFVDGDDFIDPDMYGRLISVMDNDNSKIVMCNFDCYINQVFEPPSKNFNFTENSSLYGLDKLEAIIRHNNMFVWNKLYPTSLFKKYRFPIDMTYEDAFIMPQLIAEVNSLSILSTPLYHYTARDDSITRKKFTASRFDMFYSCQSVYDYICNYTDIDSEVEKICRQRLFLCLLECTSEALNSGDYFEENINNIIEESKNYSYLNCGLNKSQENMINMIYTDLHKFYIYNQFAANSIIRLGRNT